MSDNKLLPVIMAGGSGTRLWPLSRELFPKQFLKLLEERSLFQETIKRLTGLDHAKPIVICNEAHRFIVAEQLHDIGVEHGSIILEPVGRNTAPAIALATLKLLNDGQDPLLLVQAADHLINDTEAFHRAIDDAKFHAEDGRLVTFGIVPTAPETGYGYIHRGKALQNPGFQVSAFVEKPDLGAAEKYKASGEYYWNSGMFLFRASRYLEELEKFRPDIVAACKKSLEGATLDQDFFRIDQSAFVACPSDSIDYAVMEKTKEAVVVPLDAGWSDVGSWSALWDLDQKDDQGNACQGDTILQDTHNSLVHAESKLVAVIGLDDVAIIETKDAVLVASKEKAQDVKKIVERLKADDCYEIKNHREVYCPWGHYDAIDIGKRYQVKRIMVKAGAKLSVQVHHHRSEHWIVVTGTAKITKGEDTFLLTENESTYIPVGVVHALENPGKIPLEMIEVQSGSYLGEDDIVRLEDQYGRAGG